MPDSETPLLPLTTHRSWAVEGEMAAGMSPPLQVEVTEGLALFQAAASQETNGYASWKAEAEAARRSFEKRWGVPLGKRVRVHLRGEAHEREGLLRLAEEPAEKSTKTLRLKLGEHAFPAAEIESLVRM